MPTKESGNDPSPSATADQRLHSSMRSPPPPNPKSEGSRSNGEHTFSLEELRQLKLLFDEYPDGMDLTTFLSVVGPQVRRHNPGITDEDIKLLFKRIDANASDSVEWDEISMYLLTNEEKETKQITTVAKSIEYSTRPIRPKVGQAVLHDVRYVFHQKPISHLLVHPRFPRYYTASTDGMVKFWHADSLLHERTVHKCHAPVTDICLSHWDGTLCVATLDGSICFYNADTGELYRAYVGGKKRKIQNARGQWIPDDRRQYIRRPKFSIPMNTKEADLVRYSGNADYAGLGAIETSVPILKHFEKDEMAEATVLENLGWIQRNRTSNSPESPTLGDDSSPGDSIAQWERLGYPTAVDTAELGGYDRLLVGLSSGHMQIYDLSTSVFGNSISTPVVSTMHVHWDAITRLKVVPRMDFLLSASNDATVQVRHLERLEDVGTTLGAGLLPIEHLRGVHDQQYSYNIDPGTRGHLRRIVALDWDEPRRLIATCAPERDALLWSPYMERPLAKLEAPSGSRAFVLDVRFNSKDGQLISLNSDNTIRLWDLRTYQCLQTISDTAKRESFMDDVQCIAYDKKRESIVAATHKLKLWPATHNLEFAQGYSAHRRPIVSCAFASEYFQFITADVTMVIVWDLPEVYPSMRWEVPERVADICLDSNERRLLVGTQAGTINVYNYVNGFPLKTCQPPPLPKGISGGPEVNSVAFGVQLRPREAFVMVSTREHGVAAIYVDDDGGEDAPQRIVHTGHDREVYCSLVLPPSLLILGTSEGISSYSLEEISDRALPYTPLPSRGNAVSTTSGSASGTTPKTVVGFSASPRSLLSAALPGPLKEVPFFTLLKQRHSNGAGSGTDDLQSEQDRISKVTECITALPSSNIVVSGCGQGLLHFWDITTQEEFFKFQCSFCPGDGLYSLAVNADESLLYAGDHAGYVWIFDVTDLVAQRSAVRKQSQATTTAESSVMLSAGSLYSSLVREETMTFAVASPLRSSSTVLLSPNASAYPPYYEVKLVRCFRAHVGAVAKVACLGPHQQDRLLTGGQDCRVHLWESTGRHVLSVGDPSTAPPWRRPPHSASALTVYDQLRAQTILLWIKSRVQEKLQHLQSSLEQSWGAVSEGNSAGTAPPASSSVKWEELYREFCEDEIKRTSPARERASDVSTPVQGRPEFALERCDDLNSEALLRRVVGAMLEPSHIYSEPLLTRKGDQYFLAFDVSRVEKYISKCGQQQQQQQQAMGLLSTRSSTVILTAATSSATLPRPTMKSALTGNLTASSPSGASSTQTQPPEKKRVSVQFEEKTAVTPATPLEKKPAQQGPHSLLTIEPPETGSQQLLTVPPPALRRSPIPTVLEESILDTDRGWSAGGSNNGEDDSAQVEYRQPRHCTTFTTGIVKKEPTRPIEGIGIHPKTVVAAQQSLSFDQSKTINPTTTSTWTLPSASSTAFGAKRPSDAGEGKAGGVKPPGIGTVLPTQFDGESMAWVDPNLRRSLTAEEIAQQAKELQLAERVQQMKKAVWLAQGGRSTSSSTTKTKDDPFAAEDPMAVLREAQQTWKFMTQYSTPGTFSLYNTGDDLWTPRRLATAEELEAFQREENTQTAPSGEADVDGDLQSEAKQEEEEEAEEEVFPKDPTDDRVPLSGAGAQEQAAIVVWDSKKEAPIDEDLNSFSTPRYGNDRPATTGVVEGRLASAGADPQTLFRYFMQQTQEPMKTARFRGTGGLGSAGGLEMVATPLGETALRLPTPREEARKKPSWQINVDVVDEAYQVALAQRAELQRERRHHHGEQSSTGVVWDCDETVSRKAKRTCYSIIRDKDEPPRELLTGFNGSGGTAGGAEGEGSALRPLDGGDAVAASGASSSSKTDSRRVSKASTLAPPSSRSITPSTPGDRKLGGPNQAAGVVSDPLKYMFDRLPESVQQEVDPSGVIGRGGDATMKAERSKGDAAREVREQKARRPDANKGSWIARTHSRVVLSDVKNVTKEDVNRINAFFEVPMIASARGRNDEFRPMEGVGWNRNKHSLGPSTARGKAGQEAALSHKDTIRVHEPSTTRERRNSDETARQATLLKFNPRPPASAK
jgi:WD40 repeat protein